MASEYYVFEEGGKDNTARRALFNTFINVVSPDKGMDSKEMVNIDLEQDRHYAGFRKSAGIWYHTDKRDMCWDRRLVLWMRAQSGSFLPFYDTEGELVTDQQGRPLEEAAVCTLEVVLRNTAAYTTGFLLLPKYKRRSSERLISKASSWVVIGYFPFPSDSEGPVTRIEKCETDRDKIQAFLLAHKAQKSEASSRVAAMDGDFKPTSSVVATKRIYKLPYVNQNKRRNIELEPSCEGKKKELRTEMESPVESPVEASPVADMKEQDDDEEALPTQMPTPATTMMTESVDGELPMCSKDEKEEDDYVCYPSYDYGMNDFDSTSSTMSLFHSPNSDLDLSFQPLTDAMPGVPQFLPDFLPDFSTSQFFMPTTFTSVFDQPTFDLPAQPAASSTTDFAAPTTTTTTTAFFGFQSSN